MQWGGLQRAYGPHGERQGVSKMGLTQASQTPVPALKVSKDTLAAFTALIALEMLCLHANICHK